jgi:hypothetical protein
LHNLLVVCVKHGNLYDNGSQSLEISCWSSAGNLLNENI